MEGTLIQKTGFFSQQPRHVVVAGSFLLIFDDDEHLGAALLEVDLLGATIIPSPPAKQSGNRIPIQVQGDGFDISLFALSPESYDEWLSAFLQAASPLDRWDILEEGEPVKDSSLLNCINPLSDHLNQLLVASKVTTILHDQNMLVAGAVAGATEICSDLLLEAAIDVAVDRAEYELHCRLAAVATVEQLRQTLCARLEEENVGVLDSDGVEFSEEESSEDEDEDEDRPNYADLTDAERYEIFKIELATAKLKKTNKQFVPSLFLFKGKDHIIRHKLTCHRRSMNQSDVFLLDTKDTVFLWYGATGRAGNFHSRTRAFELAKALHDSNRKAKIVTVDNGGRGIDDFWDFLGGAGSITFRSPERDAEFETLWKPRIVLSEVSIEDSSLALTEIEGTISRRSLNSDGVFLLQTAYCFYVWMGRNTDDWLRTVGLRVAEELQSVATADTPQTAYDIDTEMPIEIVLERTEDQYFKVYFQDWEVVEAELKKSDAEREEKMRLLREEKRKQREEERRQRLEEQSGKLLKRLARPQGLPGVENLPDLSEGTIEVYVIKDINDIERVDELDVGLFNSHFAYVIIFTYVCGDYLNYNLYFWRGKYSPPGAYVTFHFSILSMLKDELEDRGQSEGLHVFREQEDKESLAFLQFFTGAMMCYRETHDEMFNEDGVVEASRVRLFRCLGSHELTVRAVEIPLEKRYLTSNGSYIIVQSTGTEEDEIMGGNDAWLELISGPTIVSVWHGQGSNEICREQSEMIVETLTERENVSSGFVCDEGEEPPSFDEIFPDPDASYCSANHLCNPEIKPRFFEYRIRLNEPYLDEIVDFAQEDLDSLAVCIIDATDIVFVWFGRIVLDRTAKLAYQLACAHVKATGRSAMPKKVHQGKEPVSFTALFKRWDPHMWDPAPKEPSDAKETRDRMIVTQRSVLDHLEEERILRMEYIHQRRRQGDDLKLIQGDLFSIEEAWRSWGAYLDKNGKPARRSRCATCKRELAAPLVLSGHGETVCSYRCLLRFGCQRLYDSRFNNTVQKWLTKMRQVRDAADAAAREAAQAHARTEQEVSSS